MNWKKIYFFAVKIHVFRVRNVDMLKNEILKKQTKKHNILRCKKLRIKKKTEFQHFKKCELLKSTQLNQVWTS